MYADPFETSVEQSLKELQMGKGEKAVALVDAEGAVSR